MLFVQRAEKSCVRRVIELLASTADTGANAAQLTSRTRCIALLHLDSGFCKPTHWRKQVSTGIGGIMHSFWMLRSCCKGCQSGAA